MRSAEYRSPVEFKNTGVPEADALHAPVIVEAVMGSTRAEFLNRAVTASGAVIGKRVTEMLKTVKPDILKVIFKDVSIYKFGPAFNIKAGSYVTV